jgi:hypothetical protein
VVSIKGSPGGRQGLAGAGAGAGGWRGSAPSQPPGSLARAGCRAAQRSGCGTGIRGAREGLAQSPSSWRRGRPRRPPRLPAPWRPAPQALPAEAPLLPGAARQQASALPARAAAPWRRGWRRCALLVGRHRRHPGRRPVCCRRCAGSRPCCRDGGYSLSLCRVDGDARSAGVLPGAASRACFVFCGVCGVRRHACAAGRSCARRCCRCRDGGRAIRPSTAPRGGDGRARSLGACLPAPVQLLSARSPAPAT